MPAMHHPTTERSAQSADEPFFRTLLGADHAYGDEDAEYRPEVGAGQEGPLLATG